MSDTSQIRPSESYSAPEGKTPEKPSQKTSHEVKETARSAKEALGTIESVESVEVGGEISEVSSTKKEGKQGTIGGSGMTYAQVKAALLQKMPTEPEMRKQIETEIKKEIKYLHAKAMKMMGKRDNFFELNNVMKKIRELRGILAMLAKAGYEAMKTLWLRFVHGIM